MSSQLKLPCRMNIVESNNQNKGLYVSISIVALLKLK